MSPLYKRPSSSSQLTGQGVFRYPKTERYCLSKPCFERTHQTKTLAVN
jgi:hypothetical protein